MMELADGRVVLHAGDCLEVLASLPENSIDAVVTDPPYHFASIVKRFGKEGSAPAQYGTDGAFARASRGFMGKEWDGGDIAFRPETWALVLRVLKPGGHMVAFGAPKNYHRLACAIEDAGFEIRDSLMWVFGSGFPKSHNISKAIDAAAGAEREVVGYRNPTGSAIAGNAEKDQSGSHIWTGKLTSDESVTDEAKQWEGWGTALKPAYEPIVLARKPLSEKTVAANVLRWGTGALNIDATRVGTEAIQIHGYKGNSFSQSYKSNDDKPELNEYKTVAGRWPANLCHDGSQGVLDLFPHTKSGSWNGQLTGRGSEHSGNWGKKDRPFFHNGDEGSAARFFYCAKANKTDRADSKHPTVKPISLMQWLVRLITPHDGTVLDPFAGSGTTGKAAVEEGMKAVLIEREPEYQQDIIRRLNAQLDTEPVAL